MADRAKEKENRINSFALSFLERQQIVPNLYADQIIRGYKEGYHQAEKDLIENALKWYCLDCECKGNCRANHKCFFREQYQRYLESGDNSFLPPKIENALNPDGSTTENYRNRHLLRRLKDEARKAVREETYTEVLKRFLESKNV